MVNGVKKANKVSRKRLLILASFGLLVAARGEMTAGEFLAKAATVEDQGMKAIFSSEAKELRGENQRVMALYEADTNGRGSCPPPKSQRKLSGDELKAYMSSLSAAERKQPYRLAFYGLMRKKYPCR